MANTIPALKTAIITAFTNNLDATTRNKLTARFVTAYASEWAIRVASGTVDNATNRGIFAADKVFDYIQDIYKSESHKENLAAIGQTESIT